jgi:2-polyprenyl-6-hydroxyphenyl methylase/3-demethylubiquinone-9 3-methyltransferase
LEFDGMTVIYRDIKSPDVYLREYCNLMSETTNVYRIKAVLETLPDLPGRVRLLDVACGAGAYARAMRTGKFENRLEIVALDREPTCVSAYQTNNPGADGIVGDGCNTGLEPDQFDLTLGLDIIEHLENEDQFLQEMYRTLKPGGWLVLSTQNSLCIEYVLGKVSRGLIGRRWMGWDPTHVRFYTAWSLARTLKRNGFAVERFNGTYYLPYYFAGRVPARIVGALGGEAIQPLVQKVFSAPLLWLDSALERLSQCWPLPYVGFGIVVLARKPIE